MHHFQLIRLLRELILTLISDVFFHVCVFLCFGYLFIQSRQKGLGIGQNPALFLLLLLMPDHIAEIHNLCCQIVKASGVIFPFLPA